MISVQYLYDFTNDLLAKDQGGWRTVDEFNRMLEAAEQTLFEFYYVRFEQTQKIVDAIIPFMESVNVNLTNGVSDLPSNYIAVRSTRNHSPEMIRSYRASFFCTLLTLRDYAVFCTLSDTPDIHRLSIPTWTPVLLHPAN